MDKKRFCRYEKDSPNKRVNKTSDEEISDRLSQEVDAFYENKVSCAGFAPELKNICEERMDFDNYMEEYKNTSLHEKTSPVISEVDIDEYAKCIAQQNAEKLDHSSEKKINSNKRSIIKNLKRAITNPAETLRKIKFTRKKGKMAKVSESKSAETSSEEEIHLSQMNKCNDISNENRISETEFKVFEEMKSGVAKIGKTKTKSYIDEKLKTQYEVQLQSNDVALPLSLARSTSPRPYDSVKSPQSSEVRSADNVLAHFGRFMQSNIKSPDRIKTDDINKGQKVSSNLGNRSLKNPTKPIQSASQDLSIFTKRVMEPAMVEDSRKVTSEVLETSVDNSADVIKNTRNITRQRIVYDERIEALRWWVIQQIKDREILLKFKIMEGKYSAGIEKKLVCIEKAQDLQEDIDMLFDALDYYAKVVNIPKRIKGYPKRARNYTSKSPTKSNDFKWEEGKVKTLSLLFFHMYKSSSSESDNINIFESIYPNKIMFAYDAYLESRENRYHESQIAEYNAKSEVKSLHLFFVKCRTIVKCKIDRPLNRCLEDYRNYINDLKLAVNENFNCLNKLLDKVSDVILPLMTYLSQSRKTSIQVLAFLNRERPDIFSKSINKNKAFFEEFCRLHFKD